MSPWRKARVAMALAAGMAAAQFARAETRDWILPAGGFYADDSSWLPAGSPEAEDVARFNLDDAYTVTFTGSRNAGRFLIGNDKVVIDLGGGSDPDAPASGFTWGLKAFTAPSILLGLEQDDVARCTIRNGTLRGINASIGYAAGTSGSMTINTGAFLKLIGAPDPDGEGIISNTGVLIVGASGSGNVTVTGAGKITSVGGRIGINAGSKGTVTVSSADSTWTMTDDLRIGGKTSGTGTLTVRGGATVTVGDILDVRKKGTVKLNGGTLTAGTFKNVGLFDFTAGTLNITKSNLLFGIDGPIGVVTHLNPSKTINVVLDATLNVDAQLILDDGHFTASHTENLGKIVFNGADALITSQTLVNRGDVSGQGTLLGDLDNRGGGEVAVDGNDKLLINGAGQNSGNIKLTGGGTIEFTRPFVNEGSGIVRGGGTFIGSQGITNFGLFNLDLGFVDIFGNFSGEEGSRVIVTALEGRFANNVTHHGALFSVGPDSTVTFKGDVDGRGSFTGGGLIVFEANYRPGPGQVHIDFQNDVLFDFASVLHIELGGLSPGEGYDQIVSTKQIVLNTVDVVLVPGFQPQLGDRFEIVRADAITYNGSIDVPSLPNNLMFEIDQGDQELVLTVVAIPEPGGLVFLGALVVVAIRRRRR